MDCDVTSHISQGKTCSTAADYYFNLHSFEGASARPINLSDTSSRTSPNVLHQRCFFLLTNAMWARRLSMVMVWITYFHATKRAIESESMFERKINENIFLSLPSNHWYFFKLALKAKPRLCKLVIHKHQCRHFEIVSAFFGFIFFYLLKT